MQPYTRTSADRHLCSMERFASRGDLQVVQNWLANEGRVSEAGRMAPDGRRRIAELRIVAQAMQELEGRDGPGAALDMAHPFNKHVLPALAEYRKTGKPVDVDWEAFTLDRKAYDSAHRMPHRQLENVL